MQKSQPDPSDHLHKQVSHKMLVAGDDTAGQFSLVSLVLPPFWADEPLHRHSTHAEGCYVLAGSLAMTVGEQTHILRAGQSALAPRGIPHRFWNPTATTATALLIATPACAEGELIAREGPPPIEPAPM